MKHRPASTLAARAFFFELVRIRRVLAWPFKRRRARIQWLTEASGPHSPIEDVPGLSEPAKKVYKYLASVTLRFGFSRLRAKTIARGAGVSERRAREAIRELELRGLLTHQHHRTWHGRGAQSYRVKRV